MMRQAIGSTLLGSCLMISLAVAANASPQIVTFDYPGASHTEAVSINATGAVTGIWSDGAVVHGFVRQPDGTMTTFDIPGADPAFGTRPSSINKNGYITGNYATLNDRGKDVPHVFVRRPDGTIDTLSVPNNGRYDYPVKITTNRTILGSYSQGRYWYGFSKPAHGRATVFQNEFKEIFVSTANDLGYAAGYEPPAGSAFVWSPDGTFTYFSDNGAATRPLAMNTAGVIAGSVLPPFNATDLGFVRAADGTMATFTAGGDNNNTWATAINLGGTIAGYFDDLPERHGFVRAPSGSIAVFDPEGSSFTEPFCINDRGVIAGTYSDQQGGHGFIRYP